MRIVLCYPVEPHHIEQIQAAAPEAEVVDAGQEKIADQLPTADIYCGHAKVPVPWKETVEQGRLQWIQSSAAGMDHCLVDEVIGSEITVSSASGILANQVADHTFALMMAALRDLPTFFRAQQKKEFIRRPTRDLHGATVGIIGFGGNGRKLASVLHPFETRLLATDYYPVDKPDYVEQLLPPQQQDEVLRQSQILILAAPLNAETRGMIGRRELELLPKDAVLVNMARGPLVVEADLVEVLKSGHLAAAAVDVTEVEPLSPNSELWELPNVIITPHVGGQCATRIDDMTSFFCENLRRYQRGERLINLVDKKLGFPKPEDSLIHWRQSQ